MVVLPIKRSWQEKYCAAFSVTAFFLVMVNSAASEEIITSRTQTQGLGPPICRAVSWWGNPLTLSLSCS